MLFHELEKIVKLPPFKGVPNAIDFMPYSKFYFQAIEKCTYGKYGKEATMLDATKVMNEFGNVGYFHWFPDIFKTTKKELGKFYQPRFALAESEFTDFIHGLTHLRSRSEHTFLGETLAVPDNLYNNGVGFGIFMQMNRDTPVKDCKEILYNQFKLHEEKIPPRRLLTMHIMHNTFFFQKEENTHYQIYLDGYFKVDIPTKRIAKDYLINPQNPFEQRLGYNTLRTIYLDMKFIEMGSKKKPFIHTAPADSCKESCKNIFTTKEEDFWIKKIYQSLIRGSTKKLLQKIVNTTSSKDSYAQKLATHTIKEIYNIKLIS